MRIIGGEFRSRTLIAPKGNDTRPTLDQVRESLFNILQFRIENARVLDLFAGSGALALEALSRGAQSAVLCDISPDACKAIARNIGSLGCLERARLMRMPAERALETLRQEKARFELIFLDPPYRMDASELIDRLMDAGLLADEGQIIVEHDQKTPPQPGEKAVLTDRRTYRGTCLSFYGRNSNV